MYKGEQIIMFFKIWKTLITGDYGWFYDLSVIWIFKIKEPTDILSVNFFV